MKISKYYFSLILFICFLNNSYATIYYVDDASNTGDVWTPGAIGNDANNGTAIGTPKATIASVLSNYVLTAGDFIYVDAGTYSETNINVTAADDGSAGSYMTIQGASNVLTIFNTTATAHTFNFATASVEYVKIMDLKVTKSTSSYNPVNFTLTGINNIWFENCVLTQAGNNEVVYGTNSSATACTNITFNNCTFTNTSLLSDSDGIEFQENFDNVIVSNCTFNIDGTGVGIYFYNASYASTSNSINTNTLNINHATAGVEGIFLDGATTSDIYSNTITIPSTSNTNSGITLQDNSSTFIPTSSNIYSNTITCYGTGININGFNAANPATNINIYSNTITMSNSGAGHVGIWLSYAGKTGNPIKIYKNRVIGGYYGIELYGDISYCQTYNNYVSNNAYSFYSNASSNDHNDLYYNSFYGTTNGAYFAELSSTDNVINNIFYTTSASAVDYGIEIIVGTNCSIFNYNSFYAPNGARVGYFAGNYTTFANWQAVDKVADASLGDENGQTGNPIFDNAASNDLDIHGAASKAYRLGTPIATFTTDIYGTSRSLTLPWIGAFELITALPIELMLFEGKKYATSNEFYWETASELNNDFFTLEKTNDGKEFETIGEKDGAGTSTDKSIYFMDDYNVRTAINYYRLKQTDYDGKFTYSELISIDNRLVDEKKEIILTTNISGEEVSDLYRGLIFIYYSDGSFVKVIR